MSDPVKCPSHYMHGYVETIYVIAQTLGTEGFKTYCMGNWIKYKNRAEYKDGAQDLAKAQQYLEWATNGLPALVKHGTPVEDNPVQDRSDQLRLACVGEYIEWKVPITKDGHSYTEFGCGLVRQVKDNRVGSPYYVTENGKIVLHAHVVGISKNSSRVGEAGLLGKFVVSKRDPFLAGHVKEVQTDIYGRVCLVLDTGFTIAKDDTGL